MSLLAHLAPPRRAELESVADLEQLIDEQHAAGAGAWPAVVVARDAYVRALAERIARRDTEPAADVLRTMPGADLYLAIACGEGDADAIAAFHAEIMPSVRPALAALGLGADAIDEVEQTVLVTVLVGDRAPPSILAYSGRGRLRSWVRSIAIRTARRSAQAPAVRDDDELERLADSVADPEVELLRTRYRDQVATALAAAMADLAPRARTVLHQYYVDHLTIDQLASLYRVDRATTARWVIAARVAILDGTRAHLHRTLGASPTEVDSILRIMRSQLNLSLRLL